MGNVIWQGDKEAIANVQASTITGTWATDDTGTLTCAGKSVVFTVGATETIAAVVAGLVALWNASLEGALEEVTALDASPDITMTADTAGTPFVFTTSEDTAGDGEIGNPADSTANSSPADWDANENWDTGTAPAAADSVYLQNTDADVKWGLGQSAVTLAVLEARQSFTGDIGLPRTNVAGTHNFSEYRDAYLAIGATICRIGQGDGTGSRRLKINFGTVQTAATVYNSGTRIESDVPAVLLKGTHASNVLTVLRGDVGVAFFAGETAVIATLTVGYVRNVGNDATVYCGAGVTLTTVNKRGGKLTVQSAVTTLTHDAGEMDVLGSATVGTLDLFGGTVYYQSSGTVTTANVSDGGHLDFSRDTQARIVTNCNLYKGGKISDPHKTVTWTNGINLVDCSLADVTLDVGTDVTITPS